MQRYRIIIITRTTIIIIIIIIIIIGILIVTIIIMQERAGCRNSPCCQLRRAPQGRPWRVQKWHRSHMGLHINTAQTSRTEENAPTGCHNSILLFLQRTSPATNLSYNKCSLKNKPRLQIAGADVEAAENRK